MKCWSSILWCATGLLLLSALNEVWAKKMPKYCKRAKKPTGQKTNYCGLESCHGQENIGCKNPQTFKDGCLGKMFTVSDSMRNFIVKQHNIYRNIVARGKLHDLPPSGRMLKMQWHEELAEIAKFAAYRCSIGPVYRCFSTMEYPGPGFNSVYNKFPNAQDPTKIVRSQLKVWYEQYQYSDAKSVLTGESPGGQEIGHFLQMMSGLSDRIGCAIYRAKHSGFNYQVMICAYSCSHQKNVPVYKLSRLPAEHCTCGSDQVYKNLCSGFERVQSCDMGVSSKNLSHDSTLIGYDYDNIWGGDAGKKHRSNASSPLDTVSGFISGVAEGFAEGMGGQTTAKPENIWRLAP